MSTYTIHPDLTAFSQAELASAIVDTCITDTVRGYAKEALAVRMLEDYQAAVDAKYATEELSDEWMALDAKCDRLCWEYVVAVHCFFPGDQRFEWL